MLTAINNSLFVAVKYLRYHTLRSVLLVVSLAIIIFVPLLIEIMISSTTAQLASRGESTPLLMGATGSSLELSLNAMHFSGKRPQDITLAAARSIDESGLGFSIPLYTRFKAKNSSIVATTLDYFDFRKLKIEQGRTLAVIGEAVIGNRVVQLEKFKLGDTIISSSENLFDLAGVYPLQLKVVGVLKKTGTADDDVIFVDLKTAWIMAGIGHGHQDLATTRDSSVILSRNNSEISANAKLRTFNTITSENIKAFHFHSNDDQLPITAAIVVPNNHKALSILLGRYQDHPDNLQLIQPRNSINELFASIFRVKKMFYSVIATVAASTLIAVLLAFMLSIKLRAKELNTIFRMGCSRMAVGGFIAAEVFIVIASSLVLSIIFLTITQYYLPSLLTLWST